MNGMLNEADREVIRQAAESEKYLSSPVPQEIYEQLGDDLREFVFVPYQSQSRLADLYGVESGALELLQRDWEEARACGSLRMHDERAVSFATHVQLANGEAVEVSISESNHEGESALVSLVRALGRAPAAHEGCPRGAGERRR